jgi:hypothetical protein
MSRLAMRKAEYGDIPAIARLLSICFWHDNLFGDLIHPYRDTFSRHPDLYWLRRARVSFWDPRQVWLLIVEIDEDGNEYLIVHARWTRKGYDMRQIGLWKTWAGKSKFKRSGKVETE